MYRNIFLFAFVILFGCSTNDTITKVTTFRTSVKKSFDLDGAVNKHTGKRINEQTAAAWINTKKVPYEFVVDKYGEISKIEFDTTLAPVKEFNLSIGDKFPEFVFQTIGERILNSNERLGNNVLIQFHITSDIFAYSNLEHQELETVVAKSKMTAILVFNQLNPDLVEKPGYMTSKFHIVKDSKWFFKKFGIKSSPVTFLLDQEGTITNIFTGNDKVTL